MARPDLSRRSAEREWMDAEDIPFTEFQACLRDLARVNMLTFAYRPTLSWLRKAIRNTEGPVSILDVASGYGDMLRRIHAWAEAAGVPASLTGVDLNPWSQRSASHATPAGMPIRYRTGDVFDLGPDERFDYVVSSLFTHHLRDDEVARFIRWMEEHAARGWFINDIHRHALPYYAVKHATRALRFHRMVSHDGPISVARAFTRRDWEARLSEAGLPPGAAEIRWYLPFRYCVGRIK